MSHYTGYYGKVIVRQEFFDIIENGLNLSGTTDPVFLLYDNLNDEDRFDRGKDSHIIWEKYCFDRKNGCWEFQVEYNESNHGCPHVNLIDYFIPYISKEIIDFHDFDEYDPPPCIPGREMLSSLKKQIIHREKTIKEICKELESYRR